MSKKKKQSSKAGLYAMCVTVGLIVGLGLGPMMGNVILMIIIGGLGGTAVAYTIDKKAPKPKRKHHP